MGDLLYAGSCGGLLFAFDRETGGIFWEYDVTVDGGANFHGDMLVRGDMLFIGTDGDAGHLYAFDLATGEVRWKHHAGVALVSDVLGAGGRVYGVSTDENLERLLCLDQGSGEVLWTHERPVPEGQWMYFKSPDLVGDDIYLGALDGTVSGFDSRTGDVQWETPLEERLITAVVVRGSAIYVAGESTTMYRIRRADGQVEARRELGGRPFGPPTPMGGSIIQFVNWSAPSDNEVVALAPDLQSVKWRWSPPEDDTGTSARPYRHGNELIVGTSEGRVVALDLEDGRPTWSLRVGGTVRTIRFAGQDLYIGTLEGPLHALRLGDIEP